MEYFKTTRALIGGLLLCSATLANATPVTWDLSGVTFDDGTSASGSFTYDAGSDILSTWSITTQAGSMQGVANSGANYTPSTSNQYGTTIGTGGYYANNGAGVVSNDELFLSISNGNYLELDFASLLTDAGGVSSLILGNENSVNGTSLETDGFGDTRYVTAGSVSSVSSVPEPTSIALAGIALVGLVAARRRKPV